MQMFEVFSITQLTLPKSLEHTGIVSIALTVRCLWERNGCSK